MSLIQNDTLMPTGIQQASEQQFDTSPPTETTNIHETDGENCEQNAVESDTLDRRKSPSLPTARSLPNGDGDKPELLTRPTSTVATEVQMEPLSYSLDHHEIHPYDVEQEEQDEIKSPSDDRNPAAEQLPQPISARKTCTAVCTNYFFWIRFFVLALSIMLFLLSTAYCIAQLIEAKLDIITICPQPKTREEIWRHSYEHRTTVDGQVILTEEAQYGYTDEPCWTTNKIQLNTDELWYSNKYIAKWRNYANGKCILFGLISTFAFFVICYNVVTLVADIWHIYKGRMHKKSKLYEKHIRDAQAKQVKEDKVIKKCSWAAFSKWYWRIYFKFFVNDTTGWIIMKGQGQGKVQI